MQKATYTIGVDLLGQPVTVTHFLDPKSTQHNK